MQISVNYLMEFNRLSTALSYALASIHHANVKKRHYGEHKLDLQLLPDAALLLPVFTVTFFPVHCAFSSILEDYYSLSFFWQLFSGLNCYVFS